MEDEIRDNVLLLLGITIPDDSQDKIIRLLISDTIEAVKAYCRIEFVPVQLVGLLAQMVVKQFRDFGYGSDTAPTEVTSVSEGGRSVSFKSKTASGIISDYRARLKPYINIKGRVPSDLDGDTDV